MSEQARTYPALDVAWPPQAGDRAMLEDLLAAALDDLDPTAIQEYAASWRVFFASAPARDHAADALEAGFQSLGVTVTALEIADEDWARRSQAHLSPVRVGRFIVAPPWRVPPASERGGALLVLIEPSMGFGTGHHA
ncbi:MAG: 50S ribosomal protein L11 methyltransferase, partial [Acidobacteria bacterium]|nr:50S ribosomal protein L11 methyltransferase [Acidobacteriota bacterium]